MRNNNDLKSNSFLRLISSILPQWCSHKEFVCNSGDTGNTASMPRSGPSPGRGNGNPFQCSCWENPMDRGVWRVVGPRAAESDTIEQLSTHTLQVNAKGKITHALGGGVCMCVCVCPCALSHSVMSDSLQHHGL